MSVKQIRTKDGELKNEDMDTTDSKTTNTNVPVGGGGPFAGTRARNRGKPKDMVLSEENFTLAKTLDEQNVSTRDIFEVEKKKLFFVAILSLSLLIINCSSLF